MRFEESIIFDSAEDASFSLAVADLNADGYPDVVVANNRSRNRAFINGGEGQKWTPVDLADEGLSTYDIIAADLTNNGQFEILEANSDAINRYYRIRK